MIGIFKGIKKVLLIILVFWSSLFFINAVFIEIGIIPGAQYGYEFTQGPFEDFVAAILHISIWLLFIAFGLYHLDPKRTPEKGFWKFKTYLPPRQTNQLTPLFSGIICLLFNLMR